eukprot:3792757-Prorocentrum_lima.AAC.1
MAYCSWRELEYVVDGILLLLGWFANAPIPYSLSNLSKYFVVSIGPALLRLVQPFGLELP